MLVNKKPDHELNHDLALLSCLGTMTSLRFALRLRCQKGCQRYFNKNNELYLIYWLNAQIARKKRLIAYQIIYSLSAFHAPQTVNLVNALTQNAIESQQPLILDHHSLVLIDLTQLIGNGQMPGWPIRNRVWWIAAVKDLMQIVKQTTELLRFHQKALFANRRDRIILAIDEKRIESHQSVLVDGQMLLGFMIGIRRPRLWQAIFFIHKAPRQIQRNQWNSVNASLQVIFHDITPLQVFDAFSGRYGRIHGKWAQTRSSVG